MVGKGHKVQFRETSGGFEAVDGVRVGAVPSGGIDVVVVGKVIQVLNETSTEADLWQMVL